MSDLVEQIGNRVPVHVEVRQPGGPPVPNQRCWLYTRGTTTQVSFFPDNQGPTASTNKPLTQPLRTDSRGVLRGYAGEPGRQDVVVIDDDDNMIFTLPIESFAGGIQRWIVPTNAELLSSWTQDPFGTLGFGPFRYYKSSEGIVYLDGLLGGGTTAVGDNIYIFPAGYRPAADMTFITTGGANGFLRLNILDDGTMETQAGDTNNAFFSFNGMHWKATH